MRSKRSSTYLGSRTARAIWASVLCNLGASCYPYHIYQFGGPEGREMGNQPATEWQKRTLNSWLWGIVR